MLTPEVFDGDLDCPLRTTIPRMALYSCITHTAPQTSWGDLILQIWLSMKVERSPTLSF
jgi:hypothetical protein